jgi:hypothetical protein
LSNRCWYGLDSAFHAHCLRKRLAMRIRDQTGPHRGVESHLS